MNADGSKTIVDCAAVKRQDLTNEEEMQMRIFYWAAYYGLNKYLKYMILHKRWSPFIKSFRNRTVISGAIWGEQLDTIRLLIGEYAYEGVSSNQLVDFARTVFNKDESDNNCLHYAYMMDMPEVR